MAVQSAASTSRGEIHRRFSAYEEYCHGRHRSTDPNDASTLSVHSGSTLYFGNTAANPHLPAKSIVHGGWKDNDLVVNNLVAAVDTFNGARLFSQQIRRRNLRMGEHVPQPEPWSRSIGRRILKAWSSHRSERGMLPSA